MTTASVAPAPQLMHNMNPMLSSSSTSSSTSSSPSNGNRHDNNQISDNNRKETDDPITEERVKSRRSARQQRTIIEDSNQKKNGINKNHNNNNGGSSRNIVEYEGDRYWESHKEQVVAGGGAAAATAGTSTTNPMSQQQQLYLEQQQIYLEQQQLSPPSCSYGSNKNSYMINSNKSENNRDGNDNSLMDTHGGQIGSESDTLGTTPTAGDEKEDHQVAMLVPHEEDESGDDYHYDYHHTTSEDDDDDDDDDDDEEALASRRVGGVGGGTDESDDYHDDPYVYSDDSGSLSDAYFFPQQQERNRPYFQQRQHGYHQPLHLVTSPNDNFGHIPGLIHSLSNNNNNNNNTGEQDSLTYSRDSSGRTVEQMNLLNSIPQQQQQHHHQQQQQHLHYLHAIHHHQQQHPNFQYGGGGGFSSRNSYGSISSVESTSPNIYPKTMNLTSPLSHRPSSPATNSLSGSTILEDYPVGDIDQEQMLTYQHYFQQQQQQQQGAEFSSAHQQLSNVPQHLYQPQLQQLPQYNNTNLHTHHHNNNSTTRPKRKSRKQLKRSKRRQMIQNQQQFARERAVTQIRGKLQEQNSCHDSIFAFLFVLQLIFVTVCAFRYGITLIQPLDNTISISSPTTAPTTDIGGPSSSTTTATTSTTSGNQGFISAGRSSKSLIGGVTTTQGTVSIRSNSNNTTATPSTNKAYSTNDDDDYVEKDGNNMKDENDFDSKSSTAFSYSSITGRPSESNNSTLPQNKSNITSSPSRTGDDDIDFSSATKTFSRFSIDCQNVINLSYISGVYACVISYLTFGFMLIIARSLIQTILIFSVLLSLIWGIVGITFLDPHGIIAIMGFSALVLALSYTVAMWNRIPFAATNLYTALCAMRCTADIILVGALTLFLAFGWCLVWSIALIGIVNNVSYDDCVEMDECYPHNENIPLYLFLLFSFYWTNMVIKNITRVIVASAIGTWWYTPNEINPCCSGAVFGNARAQSVMKSMGSICFGSLVVLPAQTISAILSLGCWCCCSKSFYNDTIVTTPTSSSNNNNFNDYKMNNNNNNNNNNSRNGFNTENNNNHNKAEANDKDKQGRDDTGGGYNQDENNSDNVNKNNNNNNNNNNDDDKNRKNNDTTVTTTRNANTTTTVPSTPITIPILENSVASASISPIPTPIIEEHPHLRLHTLPPPPPYQQQYSEEYGNYYPRLLRDRNGNMIIANSNRQQQHQYSFIERMGRNLRCCNRWSYTYIGMYGYSFVEGGEKAIQLFETREWMDIVRDNLIQNVLLMASVVIGGSTGTFAVLVEEVDGYTFTTLHMPIISSFVIGSVLGFVLSNMLLLGVVGSAVNTILVCFAAGPFEFDRNHPRLSREMREVWSQQVWEPLESG